MSHQKHCRKTTRLKGYDYSQPGFYFITICTQNRDHLFGEIIDGMIVLNDAGRMIDEIWNKTIHEFTKIRLGEYVIMPNHFHGIIQIVGADSISALNRAEIDSAPTVVQTFKRHTTIKYIEMVKMGIVPPFDKRIWQRNYWDHIIRNENELYRITQYIRENPRMWREDRLNDGSGNQVLEDEVRYAEEDWMV